MFSTELVSLENIIFFFQQSIIMYSIGLCAFCRNRIKWFITFQAIQLNLIFLCLLVHVENCFSWHKNHFSVFERKVPFKCTTNIYECLSQYNFRNLSNGFIMVSGTTDILNLDYFKQKAMNLSENRVKCNFKNLFIMNVFILRII